jgi:hypothetical protein
MNDIPIQIIVEKGSFETIFQSFDDVLSFLGFFYFLVLSVLVFLTSFKMFLG